LALVAALALVLAAVPNEVEVEVEVDAAPFDEGMGGAANCRSNLTTGRAFFSWMSSCVGPMGGGPSPP
jgi:hypothetical protein